MMNERGIVAGESPNTFLLDWMLFDELGWIWLIPLVAAAVRVWSASAMTERKG